MSIYLDIISDNLFYVKTKDKNTKTTFHKLLNLIKQHGSNNPIRKISLIKDINSHINELRTTVDFFRIIEHIGLFYYVDERESMIEFSNHIHEIVDIEQIIYMIDMKLKINQYIRTNKLLKLLK